jgi:1,4-alpha-glucan branching enzyme
VLMRRAKNPEDFVVAVVNFTPVPRHGYVIGAPRPGRYVEMLNSDSAIYGGGNVGNDGVAETQPVPSHGFPQSLRLTLPPLGFLLLKPEADAVSADSSPESTPTRPPAPPSPTGAERA